MTDPYIYTSEPHDAVEISAERLKALEILEASLPEMIMKAVVDYKTNNLRLLHERDKTNPEAMNKRARRYAEKHRDVINARRREKRRVEKLKNTTDVLHTNNCNIITVHNELQQQDNRVTVKKEPVAAEDNARAVIPPMSIRITNGATVRFE